MISYMSADQSRDVKAFISEIIMLNPNYLHPQNNESAKEGN
jgi:hypothetical protein